MDTELVKEEAKRATEPLIEGFIPKLVGKKVIIRLTFGGQPVPGPSRDTTLMRSSSKRQGGNCWSSSMPLPLLSRWMSQ